MKIDDFYRKSDEERITPYPYECKECGFQEELYYSMCDDNRPLIYDCPKCNGKESMFRIFGQPIIIPFQWGDNDNKFEFGKSPSKRRHFWASGDIK